jgi:hypothetical protein
VEVEQVRHYEQLVAVMRRDHEALLHQQREETAKQREQARLCFLLLALLLA